MESNALKKVLWCPRKPVNPETQGLIPNQTLNRKPSMVSPKPETLNRVGPLTKLGGDYGYHALRSSGWQQTDESHRASPAACAAICAYKS